MFKPSDPVKPVIRSMLFGEKCEGHMYLSRIPLDEVPEDDEGAAQWLRDLYYKKVNSIHIQLCIPNFSCH